MMKLKQGIMLLIVKIKIINIVLVEVKFYY